MREAPKTILPLANAHHFHVESGLEPMTIEQEARRANEEAAKQSTKKD